MSYRQELFRKSFLPAEFAAFRGNYDGINPDRPLETAGVSFQETDPLFRSFVNETSELTSFVNEFLPQLGVFLHVPFPLPGTGLRAAQWIAAVKPGRTGRAASARNASKATRRIRGSPLRDIRPEHGRGLWRQERRFTT